MPRPSSQDIRWRAICMKEMLGHQMDEVAARGGGGGEDYSPLWAIQGRAAG